MNLIEQLHGYEKAQFHLRNLGNEHERILLQHRREHGIYEMGDYIIYEDELMVFAMWSKVISGVAYIGYAEDENGVMVSNSEFNHATDAEIEAGKRLEVG